MFNKPKDIFQTKNKVLKSFLGSCKIFKSRSVGRLDIPSEGLLILTTNPTLSTFLENPKNQIEKYHVKISVISKKFELIKMEK